MTILGPSKPRAHLEGFRDPKRDVRRAARRDLQDDQRHHPRALVHHVFVLSRCLRFSFVSFFFVTSSSVRFFFASRGRIRFFVASRGRIRKLQFGPLDVLAGPGHVVGRRSRRALTVDARSFTSDRGRIQKPARHRSRSKTIISHNSKPTSGHLKVKILNRPLDTSKSKF